MEKLKKIIEDLAELQTEMKQREHLKERELLDMSDDNIEDIYSDTKQLNEDIDKLSKREDLSLEIKSQVDQQKIVILSFFERVKREYNSIDYDYGERWSDDEEEH
jgi:hypothetical protein